MEIITPHYRSFVTHGPKRNSPSKAAAANGDAIGASFVFSSSANRTKCDDALKPSVRVGRGSKKYENPIFHIFLTIVTIKIVF